LFSLDTNILVYAADVDAGAKHVEAKNILASAIDARAGLTDQAIIEFLNATTKKKKLTLSKVSPYIRNFATNFKLMLPTEHVIMDTFALLSSHNLSVFDARLLAVCDAHGCNHLLSEDLQDGARYGGVTVVNPFNPANASLIGQLLS
jgi:predicted nucleic acid-binding protein